MTNETHRKATGYCDIKEMDNGIYTNGKIAARQFEIKDELQKVKFKYLYTIIESNPYYSNNR